MLKILLSYQALIYVVVFLIFHKTLSFAQNTSSFTQDSILGERYYKNADDLYENVDTCLYYCHMALPLLKRTGQWNKYLEIYCFLSYCYQAKNEYDSMQANNTRAHEEANQLLNQGKITKTDGGYYCTLNNLAVTLAEQKKYDQALPIFLEIIYSNLIPPNDHASFAAVKESIGYCYKELGGIDDAINYYTTAIDDWKKVRVYGKPVIPYTRLSKAYDQLASAFASQGNKKKAQDYQLKSLEILYQAEYYDPNIGTRNALRNIKVNIDLGNLNNAVGLIEKLTDETTLDNYQSFQLHHYTGLIELAKENYQDAISNFVKALKKRQQTSMKIRSAILYKDISTCYYRMNQLDSALHYINEANKQIHVDFFDKSLKGEANLDKFKILLQKSKILYRFFEVTDSTKYLNEEIVINDNISQMVENFTKPYQSKESKIKILGNAKQHYENSINATYHLSNNKQNVSTKKAFYLFEKSKSFFLLEELIVKKFERISQNVQEQKANADSYKKNIQYYKDKLIDKKINALDRDKLKAQIMDAKINLSFATTKIRSTINEQLSYDDEISLSKIQQILTPNQLLLEYFVGEQNIYLFKISASTNELIQVPNNFGLDSMIVQLFQQMKMRGKNGVKEYENTAYQLYQKLLPINDLSKYNELIIIPDGNLENLPFDVLVSDTTAHHSPKKLAYLIHDFTISYAYSSAILLEQMKQHPSAQNTLLGVFPNFAGTKKELQNSNKMCKNLKALPFLTSFLRNKEANKESVLAITEKSDILHFFTHARGFDNDYSEPSIDLQNSVLRLSDLQYSSLDAHLVVLMACETNVGEYKKGEGLMSLSRGFAYAGIPSIISSVDSVIETTTTSIITDFYKYLNEGLPKHAALRKAKLCYLENSNLSYANATPYHWGTFLAIGNMEPLTLQAKTSLNIYIILIIACLVLAVILLIRKKSCLINYAIPDFRG